MPIEWGYWLRCYRSPLVSELNELNSSKHLQCAYGLIGGQKTEFKNKTLDFKEFTLFQELIFQEHFCLLISAYGFKRHAGFYFI